MTQDQPNIEVLQPDDSPEYRETVQFNSFVKCYCDPAETETFGNATRSAIKAYNLDPVKQYSHARSWGSELVKKCNFLARDYLESKGITFQKMLDIAVSKMFKTDHPRWWELVMDLTEYKKQSPEKIELHDNRSVVNTYNLSSPEVANFNDKFLKFIQSENKVGISG